MWKLAKSSVFTHIPQYFSHLSHGKNLPATSIVAIGSYQTGRPCVCCVYTPWWTMASRHGQTKTPNWKSFVFYHGYTLEVSHSPWKMMVVRVLSFWDGNSSGGMLNFQGVCHFSPWTPSLKNPMGFCWKIVSLEETVKLCICLRWSCQKQHLEPLKTAFKQLGTPKTCWDQIDGSSSLMRWTMVTRLALVV